MTDTSAIYDKSQTELSDMNDIKQLIKEMKDDISKHMEKLTYKNITFNDLKLKLFDDSIKITQNKVDQNFTEIIHLIKNLSKSSETNNHQSNKKLHIAEDLTSVDHETLKSLNIQKEKDSDSKISENMLKQNYEKFMNRISSILKEIDDKINQVVTNNNYIPYSEINNNI